MCPCNPLDVSNINPPSGGPNLGFVPQLPNIAFPFPNLPFDDLLGLFDKLGMLLPPGLLKPHLSPNFSKNVLDAVQSLLEAFMPFLMIYKFILPILNLILCIIEVLCSLTNPFKLIKTLIRLFRVCIPEFLAIFPIFAIIIMIISLLLLLLALIEYLIERILALIATIIKNIENLATAVKTANSDSIIAITAKIGDLLCLLQNLFVLFGVILLIIQLINAIRNFSFRIPPCDDDNSGDDGCCTPDYCPSFIRNNDTIPNIANSSPTGTLRYYRELSINSGLALPAGFPAFTSVLRQESWQFYDSTLDQSHAFINISNAFDLPQGVSKIFFPSGVTYDKKTTPTSTPYVLSMRLFYEPAKLGRDDPKGSRFIKINKAIVQSAPISGVSDFNGTLIGPFNGTLNLIGGTVTEDDGKSIFDSSGNLMSINDIIHAVPNTSGVILTDDSIKYEKLEYTLEINHEILVSHDLITLGCVPELALNKNFINTTIGGLANANIAGLNAINLPDVDLAQQCVLNAIAKFRQNVSVESANSFQSTITTCLSNLQNQTISALSTAIDAGFDNYNSDFNLDPSIQFTTKPIVVTVNLKDGTKNSITKNLPVTVAKEIAEKITANITFGNISDFEYNGSDSFTARLRSNESGNGTIQIAFNNKFISTIDNPSDLTQNPSVTINTLKYTFVQSTVLSTEPRRDESDIANMGNS